MAVSSSRPSVPFRQLPYDEVPLTPVRPHRWSDATRRDVNIRTDGLGATRVAIREYGAGPPLLLVHGMGTTGYSFRYVLEPLGHTYRLLIPDLPGAGDSDHPDVYLGADVMARALLAIIDALGIRGAPAIANSMGGYLTMRAVLLDPGALSRLVNLHSPGVPTTTMYALRWAMRLLPSWPIIDWMIRRNPDRWVHQNVHYYDESLKSREEQRVYAGPLRSRAGRRTYYRQLRDTLDTDGMRDFVHELRVRPFPIPLWLVYAPRDPVVPPIVGDRLATLIPNATFVRLSSGSHFAHVDATEKFLAAIESFLRLGG